MNKNNLGALALILTLAGSVTRVQAADAEAGEALLKKLYLKLSTVLLNYNDEAPKNVLFTFANPGIGLPEKPNMNNKAEAEILLSLADDQILPGPVAVKTGGRLSDAYNHVLLNKVSARTELTKDEQEKLNALLDLVKADGTAMQKYNDLEDDYVAASTKLAIAQQADAVMAAKTKADGSSADSKISKAEIYKKEVARALRLWQTDGRRDAIDAAFGKIREYDNKDQSAWWERLVTTYNLGLDQFKNRLAVFNPKPADWNKNSGWVKFSFSSNEASDSSKNSSRDISAAASINVGKFGFSGSGGNSLKEGNTASKSMESTIEFELKRVFISRPWLDVNVFKSHGWKFNDNFSKDFLSSGETLQDAQNGKARMPMLTESLILIRNLVVTGGLAEDMTNFRKETTKAKAKIKYGPFFSANASYEKTDEAEGSSHKESQASITSEEMQVIGFISTFLPKAPDPNPDIKW